MPVLRKRILYLDQLAISNMMKALNPRAKAHQARRLDPFWRAAFEKIDSLCKLQVLICPDSIIHIQESLVAPYYQALKRMYESLSHGISFQDPDTIRRFQLCEHAKWWVKSESCAYSPTLDPSRVLSGPIDGWQNRFLISIDFAWDEEWIDSLRKSREERCNAIRGVFSMCQTEPDKDFDHWYRKEMQGFGQAILWKYNEDLMQFGRGQLGIEKPNSWTSPESPAVIMICNMHKVFRDAGIPEDELWPKTHEYFDSGTQEMVPFCRIGFMLWAAIARKAAAGQRRPPNRGTVNDIDAISTLLPYCDAMFVDRECYGYLQEEPLRSKLDYKTRVFSLVNKDEFLEYLDGMRKQIPQDHLKLVEEVYGPDWHKSSAGMYGRGA